MTMGKPITNSTMANGKTHSGNVMFWARTSTTWSAIQLPTR